MPSFRGILIVVVCLALCGASRGQDTDFDRTVAPLFAGRCLGCHNAEKSSGGLDLSSRQPAMKGGTSGVVIEPGQPETSLLWQHVESDVMPPKNKLTAEEKETVRTWLRMGALWGTDVIDPFRYSSNSRAGTDWWSLQPLTTVVPPETGSEWVRNPIDAFVFQTLQNHHLEPSREASRQTLIRRVAFDLTGLPPTPEQVRDFLNDPAPDAWERLVDQLLASPHYGERWARHWLDVVRFGESNGFEYDEPRNNFWPYRNWVISALNRDIPYDEFTRLQLAGDVLFPDDPDAVAAVGFLVSGPHNTTLPSNDRMRMSMAQDELEDLVGTIGQTFLGLTVNCGRCHDHKFDPISQKDYYQFAATLTGVSHGERTIRTTLTQDQQNRLKGLRDQLSQAETAVESMERPAREAVVSARKAGQSGVPDAPDPAFAWEFDKDGNDVSGGLPGRLNGAARLADGALIVDGNDAWAATDPVSFDVAEKTLEAWVRLDDPGQAGGAAISLQTLDGTVFDAIVFGEREPRRWMAGSNGFVRTQSFQGPEETEAGHQVVHIAVVYQSDGTISAFRNGRLYGTPCNIAPLQKFAAGKAQFVFGLRHIPAGGNRLLKGQIHRAAFHSRALSASEVAASAAAHDPEIVTPAQLRERMTESEQEQHRQLLRTVSVLKTELQELTASENQMIYTCVGVQPGPTQVLRRGDVSTPGETVAPGGISAVPGLSADFQLPPDASDAERRRKLAEWISSRRNAVYVRVMANRTWHHHFGQGIVNTPSDFGFNGGRPSHPELLEWLSGEFVRSGLSLKQLHRLIVTSATYRQESVLREDGMRVDAENRLLWRKTPERLDAEGLRDALLAVTEQLNPRVGGRGYRDVEHYKFKGSNFYRLLDESESAEFRRTIYRFAPRGGRNPFLDTFDCPDPSAAAPKRATTITPLQALSMMNNALVFQASARLADNVQQTTGSDPEGRISEVYLRAFGRAPESEELLLARDFVGRNGLAAWCRVILNSNEFLFVP